MPFRPGPNLPDFLRLKAIWVGARQQVENNHIFQTIIELLDLTQKLKDNLNSKITVLEASDTNLSVNVRDAGYWSPLVVSNNSAGGLDTLVTDNGLIGELVVTDTGQPIMVWVPTP